ncbi:MAG: hypothetical protein WB987_16775 [Candidatus Acidiferrales bacterium]
MTEKTESNGGGAEKRRSTRVLHTAPITVKGTDALGQPFRESTKTVMVNCFGCLYQSTRYPSQNSVIMLEVRHAASRRPPRVVPARVIWVQRPQNYRALYHVGIEFEVPGNVWDIAMPPEDWFPCPEDEELVVPVASEENRPAPNQFVIRETSTDAEISKNAAELQANPAMTSGRATETLFLSDDQRVLEAQVSTGNQEEASPAMQDIVRMATAEAIAEEIGRIRDFIDVELQDAIDKAVDRLISRITQSPAFQQFAVESQIAEAELTEAPEPTSDPAETPAPPAGQNAAEDGHLNARQRRAAKRSRRGPRTAP